MYLLFEHHERYVSMLLVWEKKKILVEDVLVFIINIAFI